MRSTTSTVSSTSPDPEQQSSRPIQDLVSVGCSSPTASGSNLKMAPSSRNAPIRESHSGGYAGHCGGITSTYFTSRATPSGITYALLSSSQSQDLWQRKL